MFQAIQTQFQTQSVNLLETIVQKLEKIEPLQKRPRVYAKSADEIKEIAVNADDASEVTKEKLKQLSFELIDIGLHTSKIGLETVQSSQTYLQECVQGLEQKVRENSVQLYRFLNDNVYTPLTSNLYVIYDRSTHMLSFLMEVIIEHQQKLREYLHRNYENVTVIIKENWMRLDFNKDGHVSIEDIKQGAQDLFEFLKNFDYLQKATEIKSSLYQEAIKYMKRDLNGAPSQSQEAAREAQPVFAGSASSGTSPYQRQVYQSSDAQDFQ